MTYTPRSFYVYAGRREEGKPLDVHVERHAQLHYALRHRQRLLGGKFSLDAGGFCFVEVGLRMVYDTDNRSLVLPHEFRGLIELPGL